MPFSNILIIMIRFYQRCISTLMPPACRFFPTCSQYSIDAVKKHGSVKGLFKAILRLSKCHPFHPGGYDPVR